MRRFDEKLRLFHQMPRFLRAEYPVLIGMAIQQIERELAARILARIRRLEELRVVEASLELRDDAIRIVREIPELRAHEAAGRDEHRLIRGLVRLLELVLLELHLRFEVALLRRLQIELD